MSTAATIAFIIAVAIIVAAFVLFIFAVGYVVASFREYRDANIKKIEDNVRRNLLEDVEEDRVRLRAIIAQLEKKIEALRTDLADIRKSTFDQIAVLQKELKEATLNSIRHERDLSGEMARREKLQDEIHALREGEKPPGDEVATGREPDAPAGPLLPGD